MRLSILDDYQKVSRKLADWSAIERSHVVDVFDAPFASEDELVAALGPYEIICAMRERSRFPSHVLERLPNLRMIVTTGMRNVAIDVGAATRLGILVCGTGSIDFAYVEHAWALILAMVRNIAAEDANVRRGGWQTTVGTGLHGRTLGVLGLGGIGTRMVPIARAFGLAIIAWSPNLTEEKCDALGVRYVSRDDLFSSADIVTVHMVLSERTRGLIIAEDFSRMKPDAFFVNTSRGPIVDEAALVATLQERRIRGCALDVYDVEPLPLAHPLRGLDNVVLSPHLGFVTEENYRRYFEETVEDIAAFLVGQPIRVING